MQNNQTLLGNINFKFEAGKKYHIWNGYATQLENLWWLNCVFVGYINDGDVQLLEFEHNGINSIIDAGLMYSYTKANTGKCYQFIPSGDK
jgi:hypothetical protein